MAHHNRTPKSVRKAPQRSFVLVHATIGPNREARRHGWYKGVDNINEPFIGKVRDLQAAQR